MLATRPRAVACRLLLQSRSASLLRAPLTSRLSYHSLTARVTTPAVLTTRLHKSLRPSAVASPPIMSRALNSQPAAAASQPSNESDALTHKQSTDASEKEDDGSVASDSESRFWLTMSGLSGFAGVSLASFGAHGLQALVTDVYYLDIWQTATKYHLVHALALAAAPFVVTALRQHRARTGLGVGASFLSNLGFGCIVKGKGASASKSSASKTVGRKANWAARCFMFGTVAFSGSFYLLALTENRAWGKVAPIGGAALMAGWSDQQYHSAQTFAAKKKSHTSPPLNSRRFALLTRSFSLLVCFCPRICLAIGL